ncbi:MAG: 30S ribosome-binding factor RbfA [Nitrospirae bacterium]|nr:30S ribosome-binding factor RbfA [Nitrospirota bacterium]
MLSYKRSDRLGEQIKEEIADIIMHKIHDPRIGFVTVTHVDLSDDLKNAKVYISILDDSAKKGDTISGLISAVGYIRSELRKRLRIRYIPELIFKIDDSIKEGIRMVKILDDLEKEE